MKLITKFILIYLLITVVVLAAGGVISYYIIKGEIDKELRFRYMDRIERVTSLLEQGRDFGFDSTNTLEKARSRNLMIRELKGPVEERVEVGDTMAWHPHLRRMEHNVKVTAYRQVNGQYYQISAYGALVESDDITEAVLKTLLWIMGLQVVGAIGVGFVVSGRLFKPFRTTLDRIKRFNLYEKKPIEAEQTNVEEFNELNRFVEEMTEKAVSDYRNLKEFAENASHELQTPLSIAQGKLELLSETDLDSEQYRYVESAQNSIRKLSKLSESLGLLTKIENHEFTDTEEIDLTQLIRDSLQSFDELISLHGLTVRSKLEEEVTVRMHPVLADILWRNLLQNAIKHNVENGSIEIRLDSETLEISNTGAPLEMDPDILFKRFRKADQSSESIGLGLSIVKRIINQSGMEISYHYDEDRHTINIDLNPGNKSG
ncbi:MAG: HAMP domain-containing sensor histidine kinase [Balneolaceae bacterium]|nr:HAMP domain-containing sensor histidine kinase [Balneolaceae bacterium]